MRQHTQAKPEQLQRKFCSEREASIISGLAVKTLQKDRLFGRRFPFYRVGRKILYDLGEVEAIVRAGRVDIATGARA